MRRIVTSFLGHEHGVRCSSLANPLTRLEQRWEVGKICPFFNEIPVLRSFSINHQTPQHRLALSLLLRSWSAEVLTTRNKWISWLYSDSLVDDGPQCNAMGCMISSRRKPVDPWNRTSELVDVTLPLV